MAYDTLRASGNNQYGQMGDAERASFGSAQSAQDFVLRKRLQDEALAREEALRNQGLSAQERMQQQALAAQGGMQDKALAAQQAMGGSFADRSALEDARLDRSLSPQMEALRQREEENRLNREENAPMRELKKRIYGEFTSQFGGMPGAPGAGAAPLDLKKLRQVGGIIGLNIPESDEEKRAQKFEDAQLAAAFEKVKRGGPGAASASKFLGGKGYDMSGDLFAPDPAELRHATSEATTSFMADPMLSARIQQAVPSFKASMESDPQSTAFSIQREADKIAQEAGGEGADRQMISQQIIKAMTDALKPSGLSTMSLRHYNQVLESLGLRQPQGF